MRLALLVLGLLVMLTLLALTVVPGLLRRHECPLCGKELPRKGYCSRECSVADRARKMLRDLPPPNMN